MNLAMLITRWFFKTFLEKNQPAQLKHCLLILIKFIHVIFF